MKKIWNYQQRRKYDVGTLRMTNQGYIQVPTSMWKTNCQKSNAFIIAYNLKIRHWDDASKFVLLEIFSRILKKKEDGQTIQQNIGVDLVLDEGGEEEE
jgi:hypothetical protein